MVYCREIILESSWNVSETTPQTHVLYETFTNEKICLIKKEKIII